MGETSLPESIAHGRYAVSKVLGEGGSATVYRALDTTLDREVAIKLLKASSASSETNSRYLREAQIAARLVHPNIVATFDVGTDGGHSFIAMELVDGSNLKALIQSRPAGGLSLEEILKIARQICRALEYAHARGVYHCDVKPENVLLTKDGDVKLADFGLARAVDRPRLANQEGPVGTPGYVAPEVVRGQGQDARSDLYSFGAVLYEMMTGRPPFTGKDELSLLSSQLNDVPRPPTALVPNASPALERIVLRLLEKNPESRYASASELLGDLLSLIHI